MSYCRFGNDSDVYLYMHVDGQHVCCSCRMLDERPDVYMYNAQSALMHLKGHKTAGHRVPKYALTALEAELKEINGQAREVQRRKRKEAS